ncbi:MAG: nicotinate (nicotinamide) nucleotide adenylyltransferase [Candidatus Gastranaerophilaceae bacterium]
MKLFNDIIYPGTFNPIHNGHLGIAEKARLETGIQKVVLIPAFSPYHKASDGNATSFDRFEMTKLATQSREGFDVSDVEFRMGREKSYTFETVKKLIEEETQRPFDENIKFPQKIKLLMGADAFEGLASWYQASNLAKLVNFIVVSRPQNRSVEEIAKGLNIDGLNFQSVLDFGDISSSKIRDLIKRGQDVSKLVSKPVLEYIMKNKLYR